MNTLTDQNRKMAETLRELSACPVPSPVTAHEPSTRRSTAKIAAVLVGVTVLLAGAVFGLRPEGVHFGFALSKASHEDPPAATGQPPSYPGLTTSVAAPVVQEITGSGYVVAPEMAVVYAERGGLITDILVEPGDTVTAGQSLLLIEETGIVFAAEGARLAYDAAKLSLAAARISRAQADKTLRRRAELSHRGVIADERLEDAQTALLVAANNFEKVGTALNKAELDLRVAEDRVAHLNVRAPISGTVTQLPVHVGDAVLDRFDAIHDGIGLMTIARLDRLEIDASVAEKAINSLDRNLVGEAVLDAFPDHPFSFELRRIAPEVNAAKGTVELRLTPIAPPPGTRPGMAARIRIALSPPSLQTVAQTKVNP